MGSRCRETYSYIDNNGTKKTVHINGNNKQDCDLQFQNILFGNCGVSIGNNKGNILLNGLTIHPKML